MPAVFALPGVLAALAQIALSALSSLIQFGIGKLTQSKPDVGNLANRRRQLQETIRDAARAREVVIGPVKKGGVYAYIETLNNDRDLLMAVILAGHEVQGIDEIYFFDELAISQAGVVQNKFKNLVEFEKHLGTSTQAASPLLLQHAPGWTASHRLRGIAYVVLKIKNKRDVFNSIPNVTARIRGAKLFDPRDSSTKYSTNGALAAGFVFADSTYGLGAAYGTEIDNPALITAANIADEDVAIKAGKTLAFDETNNNEVTIANVFPLTGTSFSLEARVYSSDLAKANQNMINKDSGSAGYALMITASVVRFRTRGLSNVDLDWPITFGANEWHAIAAVYDSAGQTKTIYLDGVQVQQATSVTGTLTSASTVLTLGNGLKGRLQDCRIWNDPRISTEVAAFDDKTLQGTETNLVGYWKLNELQGTLAQDATETPNDGTIKGAAWVDDSTVLGSTKRYPVGGVWFSDEQPSTVINEVLTGSAGDYTYSGGKFFILAGAFQTPTVIFDEDDVVENIRAQARLSRRDLFNAVRGTYLSPENNDQTSDFPLITNAAFETEDGGERIITDIELPFTQSSAVAQRLGYIHLLRAREQLTVNVRLKLSGLKIRAGNFIQFNNARLGWTNLSFQVQRLEFVPIEQEGGPPILGVDLTLRKVSASTYTFNPATDEIPQGVSPQTTLPSPLGQIAVVSEFVDRTGFKFVAVNPQAWVWPGTFSGLVFNPWRGYLEVEDQIGAAGNNFDVFDQYVQIPVLSGFYESPEIDIDFDDTVRTTVDCEIFKGPGEDGVIKADKSEDSRLDGGVYDGFVTINRSVSATGRFFKHRVDIDFSDGAGGYLATFTPSLDKLPLTISKAGVIVNVGGKTETFTTQFHGLPSMSASVNNAARVVNFTSISATGFTVVVLDLNAMDVGGVIDWQAVGV